MAKVRVHELAKELGITSKKLLEVLKASGEFVKSASSTIEAPVVRKAHEYLETHPELIEKKKKKKPAERGHAKPCRERPGGRRSPSGQALSTRPQARNPRGCGCQAGARARRQRRVEGVREEREEGLGQVRALRRQAAFRGAEEGPQGAGSDGSPPHCAQAVRSGCEIRPARQEAEPSPSGARSQAGCSASGQQPLRHLPGHAPAGRLRPPAGRRTAAPFGSAAPQSEHDARQVERPGAEPQQPERRPRRRPGSRRQPRQRPGRGLHAFGRQVARRIDRRSLRAAGRASLAQP